MMCAAVEGRIIRADTKKVNKMIYYNTPSHDILLIRWSFKAFFIMVSLNRFSFITSDERAGRVEPNELSSLTFKKNDGNTKVIIKSIY